MAMKSVSWCSFFSASSSSAVNEENHRVGEHRMMMGQSTRRVKVDLMYDHYHQDDNHNPNSDSFHHKMSKSSVSSVLGSKQRKLARMGAPE